MPAQRQSDREMDRAARSLVCLFGLKCRRGLDCFCGHTDVEKKLFADRKAYREKEWMAPCGFCAVGRCRYGAECQRNIRSRLSNEAYRNQRPAAAESESDYASAESGSDSGEDSTDEAGMAGPAGCSAEGAVPDCALAPFLSEDYTKVVKGWRPNVGSADVGQRGFGEPSVFWMLNVVQVPLSPGSGRKVVGDKCGVDAEDFVFKQSEGAVMSQKAQRRMARQKQVEVVWAGPAVVREQKTERRVPIGHRGSGMRKELFADSDGSSNGSGSEVEGVRSRTKNRARQRSTIINSSGYTSSAIQHQFVVKRKMAAAKVQSVREVQVVDESVDQLHRMQSLRKIQLWLWSQQVRHRMDAIRLCFQKWVGGGLAGWFIRKYARRFANFCRDVRFEFLPCEQSWSLRARGGASILEKWVDQRDLPTGNLFRQWFNAPPKDEFHAVQVAVARQSAATVLRAVLLYRAVEVAQDSDLAYLKGSFQGWRVFTSWRIRIRVQEIEWLCVRVMRDLQHWELESAWRQWKFWMGVHRAEKVLCNFRMEQIRGATRQWVFNL